MRALGLVLLGALLAGCLERGAPQDAEGVSSGTEVGSLRLTLAPASATVEGVTTWTWTLTVREETTITHRGCPPELVSVHVEVDGARIDLYEYGAEPMAGICALREMTLPPGNTTGTVQWNGEREGRAPEPHAGGRVEPGTYVVVARLGATDRELETRGTVVVPGDGA